MSLNPMALSWDSVSFSYPALSAASPAIDVLHDVNLQVPQGAFCLLTGATGSGKSTLLRLAKPQLAPKGNLSGTVSFQGTPVSRLSKEASARSLGFVGQDPSAQIVADTVIGELAFGLENLGVPQDAMKRSIAETCAFLGLDPWLHRPCAELSGGQRQLVALAAVCALKPSVLLLDEPTSQLDPVAEGAFLGSLYRLNHQLGITMVVASHRASAIAPYASMAVRLSHGRLEPQELSALASPAPLCRETPLPRLGPTVVEVHDIWMRYTKRDPWVLRQCDLTLAANELRALVGGNGSGKSSLLKTLAGITKASWGTLHNQVAQSVAYLPQDPSELLISETVGEELMEWAASVGYGEPDARAMAKTLGLLEAWEQDPPSLSGGQLQLLALGKLLLLKPSLLLLDEPVKGLDSSLKSLVADLLCKAAQEGSAVLYATHDLDFARIASHATSLMFDGGICTTQETGAYFQDSFLG